VSIIAKFRWDGSLEFWRFLNVQPGEEMDGIAAWCRMHDVDPTLLSTTATVEYDPKTSEWIFPLFVRGKNGKGIQIDGGTQSPKVEHVRRKAVN
jgi:hypothetical protein